MKKLFISAIFLFLVTLSAFAQETEKISQHSLGMAAGFTTGYGLSYRFQPNNFGVQATFAPYKSEYSQQHSFGLTLMYRLANSKSTSLYLYQGNHLMYSKSNEYDYYSYYPGTLQRKEVVTKTFNTGLGIGFEIIALKKIGINLMLGYAGYDSFKQITVTSEIGLFYKL